MNPFETFENCNCPIMNDTILFCEKNEHVIEHSLSKKYTSNDLRIKLLKKYKNTNIQVLDIEK